MKRTEAILSIIQRYSLLLYTANKELSTPYNSNFAPMWTFLKNFFVFLLFFLILFAFLFRFSTEARRLRQNSRVGTHEPSAYSTRRSFRLTAHFTKKRIKQLSRVFLVLTIMCRRSCSCAGCFRSPARSMCCAHASTNKERAAEAALLYCEMIQLFFGVFPYLPSSTLSSCATIRSAASRKPSIGNMPVLWFLTADAPRTANRILPTPNLR